MAEIDQRRITSRPMDDHDLVRHLYNRRALWGTESVLYRHRHPMEWRAVEGNYQNWQIDTEPMIPTDAHYADGTPTALFSSDDLTMWLSRRRASMPYFSRNCMADELHVIARGRMSYETDFGTIDVQERDLLVIPKGVTYRVRIEEPADTLRMIYESGPELFLVPTEMVDHVYGKRRPAVDPDRVRRPRLPDGPPPEGEFEVRVRYGAAFAEFLGDTSTICYDYYPLDVRILDGEVPVYAFSVADIEKLGSTPVPFIGAAYLDNRANLGSCTFPAEEDGRPFTATRTWTSCGSTRPAPASGPSSLRLRAWTTGRGAVTPEPNGTGPSARTTRETFFRCTHSEP